MEGGEGAKKCLKEGEKSHHRNTGYLQNSVITSVFYCHNIYTHQI